jgi:hypothetical protein
MPIERIIQLGLLACAMMAGLFLLPSNAVKPVGGLWLSFGLIIILLYRLLGGLDFKISGFLPYRMSRWWGGAASDTAKTWWLYLGVTSLVIGCIYFLVAMGVSEIKQFN